MRFPFRSRPAPVEVDVEPLVEPRATIDGWTLEGTRLAGSVPRRMQRELCTLLHGIAVRAETPYTYLRAAELLERSGEHTQAFAVCEAWLALPASNSASVAHDTRVVVRLRERLRSRLAADAARGRAVS
jgi:hypothetical protein